MKKIVFVLLMVLATVSHAVELGVVGTYNLNTTTVGEGITLGEKFGNWGLQYGFFNSVSNKGLWQHKSSFTGNYTFYTVDKFSFNAKLGAADITKQGSTADGWTTLSGLGTSYAITPQTRLTLDFIHQCTNDRVMSAYNANIIQSGIKVSF